MSSSPNLPQKSSSTCAGATLTVTSIEPVFTQFGKSQVRAMLVLRTKQDGTVYLESIENNLFKNPLDWIVFRLKNIFPFLAFTKGYQLKKIRKFLIRNDFGNNKALYTQGPLQGVLKLNKIFTKSNLSNIWVEHINNRIKEWFESKYRPSNEEQVNSCQIVQKDNGDQRGYIGPDIIPCTVNQDEVTFFCTQQNPYIRARGIENGQNRCYFNSIMKALYACPAFHKAIQDICFREDNRSVENANKLAHSLNEVFTELNLRQGTSPLEHRDPEGEIERCIADFCSNDKQTHFDIEGTQQQDAHEFMQLLLSYIFGNTILFDEVQTYHHLFQQFGIHINSLDTKRAEKFNTLIVDIPNIVKSIQSVQDVFTNFTQNECIVINEIISQLSPELQQEFLKEFGQVDISSQVQVEIPLQVITSKKVVGTTPNFLPVQIKRFYADGTKNKSPIAIPAVLDVYAGKEIEGPLSIDKYVVRSVVIHDGSTPSSGHYYTYMPDPTSFNEENATFLQWDCHDDTQVSQHAFEEIKENMEANGYIILYEKIPSQPSQ